MKALGYLLLIAFMLSIGHAGFSINELIDYLQINGNYDIIYLIKCCFGDEVAIEYCRNIVETDHCNEVVKIYMANCGGNSGGRRAPRKYPTENDLNLQARIIYDKLNLDTVDDVKRKLVIIILSFYDTLIQNMTDAEIYNFINLKILKRRRFIPLKEIELDLIERKKKRIEELEIKEKIERVEGLEKVEKIENI